MTTTITTATIGYGEVRVPAGHATGTANPALSNYYLLPAISFDSDDTNKTATITGLNAGAFYRLQTESLIGYKVNTTEGVKSHIFLGSWSGTGAQFNTYYSNFTDQLDESDTSFTQEQAKAQVFDGKAQIKHTSAPDGEYAPARGRGDTTNELVFQADAEGKFAFEALARDSSVRDQQSGVVSLEPNRSNMYIGLKLAQLDDSSDDVLFGGKVDIGKFSYEYEDASSDAYTTAWLDASGGRFHGTGHTSVLGLIQKAGETSKDVSDEDFIKVTLDANSRYVFQLQNDTAWLHDLAFAGRVTLSPIIYVIRNADNFVLSDNYRTINPDDNLYASGSYEASSKLSFMAVDTQEAGEAYAINTADASGDFYVKVSTSYTSRSFDLNEPLTNQASRGLIRYAVAAYKVEDNDDVVTGNNSVGLSFDYTGDSETFTLSVLIDHAYSFADNTRYAIREFQTTAGDILSSYSKNGSTVFGARANRDVLVVVDGLGQHSPGQSTTVAWTAANNSNSGGSAAQQLALDALHSDAIFSSSDTDRYALTLQVGRHYIIDVLPDDVAAFDPRISAAGLNDDNGGEGLAARLHFTAQSSSNTFTVEGAKHGERTVGAYSIKAYETATAPTPTQTPPSTSTPSTYATHTLSSLAANENYVFKVKGNDLEAINIYSISGIAESFAQAAAGSDHTRIQFNSGTEASRTVTLDGNYQPPVLETYSDSEYDRPISAVIPASSTNFSFAIDSAGDTDVFRTAGLEDAVYILKVSSVGDYGLKTPIITVRDNYAAKLIGREAGASADSALGVIAGVLRDDFGSIGNHKDYLASWSDIYDGSAAGPDRAPDSAQLVFQVSGGYSPTFTVAADLGGYGDYKLSLEKFTSSSPNDVPLRPVGSPVRERGDFHGITVIFDKDKFYNSNPDTPGAKFAFWKSKIYQGLELMWSSPTGREQLEYYRDADLSGISGTVTFGDGTSTIDGHTHSQTRAYIGRGESYIEYDEVIEKGVNLAWSSDDDGAYEKRPITVERAVVHEMLHLTSHWRDPHSSQTGHHLDMMNRIWREALNEPVDQSLARFDRVGYPLVIDWNDDGLVQLSQPWDSDSSFDMNGDGARNSTGWIGEGEAILARDMGTKKQIKDLHEISFADLDPLGKSDLAGLASLDHNGDMRIDAADKVWSELVIWQDKNLDGESLQHEILSLDEAGVIGVDLHLREDLTPNEDYNNIAYGNRVGGYASIELEDGRELALADVGFSYSSTDVA